MLVAYQIYTLAVEPWIDPPLTRSSSAVTDEELAAGRQSVSRYQRVLSSYFPTDHWSLTSPPIVIESGQMMLVLNDYTRNDNGSIDIDRCAVVLFQTPRVHGEPPPRDAIVLNAPGGAHLQFDDDFDPAQGRAGRIVQGSFPGTITIRSEMESPGPDDDLWIETRDLMMNEAVVKSMGEVKFRYGKSSGGGRHLEIGLARDDLVRQGMNLVGVKSLEVREDVALRLHVKGLSVTGEVDRVADNSRPTVRLVSTAQPTSTYEPPITVTCNGSFFFDLLDYEATFEDTVQVRQERLDGPFDALDCNVLSLHLAPLDDNGIPIPSPPTPNIAKRHRLDLKHLQPYILEAEGGVRLDSPIQRLAARADRVQVNLPRREMTIDTGPEIILRHADTEMHVLAYGPNRSRSPVIVYRHPASDAPQPIGDLTVTGPGWLRTQTAGGNAARTATLKWQQREGGPSAVQLRRLDGQPVLTMNGAPEIEADGMGHLTADRVQLFLREVVADGPDGPAVEIEDKPHKLAIFPDRMAATGKVEINSPQFTGTTRQLQAWFRPQAMAPSETVRVIAASNSTAGSGDQQKSNTHRFDIESEQVSVDVAVSGRRAEAVGVTCQGGVVLRETAGVKPGDEPLRVEGQSLRVEQLSTAPTITVHGVPAAPLDNAGLASIAARGLTLFAGRVNADAEHGRFWIEGPGRARIMVDGAVLGEQKGTKVPVRINWQGGLSVDGARVVCSGDVFAESDHSWLQCERVVIDLTRPIYPAPPGDEEIEIAKVSLLHDIVADHRSVDQRGQRSHTRAQLRSLTYDHRTGEISGDGPGSVRAAYLSTSSDGLPGAAPPTDNSPARLRYLRVDFLQGLSGNANQRLLKFHRRVRAIHGPIDGWQQELFANDPAGLPPDTAILNCDELQINEDPTAPRPRLTTPNAEQPFGMVEAIASGNITLEGSNKKGEQFEGSGSRLSYNQAKDVVVLEGIPPTLAELTYHDPLSGDRMTQKAQKFTYHRSIPKIQIEGLPQATYSPGSNGGSFRVPPRPGRRQ